MTVEERLDRIEHVTAGLAEQAKTDREENRELWRQTQGQIRELAGSLDRLAGIVGNLTDTVERLTEQVAANDQASRERDTKLDQRIEALVSAVGELIRRKPE